MTEKYLIPKYTGHLKKTPKKIMVKRWKEMDWKLKCVEQGFRKRVIWNDLSN